MASIKLDKLSKEYETPEGRITAVDELDLEIKDGEFAVFVGPSGCGKTTTLRCIAGLEEVTRGHVMFGDQDVTSLSARNRDIAMVFQNYALYPHMTVKKNMTLGLKLSTKKSTEEINELVAETAEMLSIEDLLLKKPKELSGGQQQRVALGRSIVREPEVFLLDEPLSNLDAKLRSEMRTEIQELQSRLGITSVYVTHDQTEAMAMGDRIVVLNGGELQQVGTPEEIYQNPNNMFVGKFIGSPSMNTFPVQSDGMKHNCELVGPGGFSYHINDAEVLSDIKDVHVGIRPEDLSFTDDSGIPAVVNVVEPMGNEDFVYLSLGSEDLIARVKTNCRPAVGDEIHLTFDESDLYLFDTESGNTIKSKKRIVSRQL